MTDLTEQFLDDEIDESKLYYFKQKMSEEIEVGKPFALNMVRAIDEIYLDYFLIDKVLAEVPSYDEWFKIKNLASLSQCLQEKNIECLHRENKVKELLKECKQLLMSSNYENMAQYHKVLELRDKIDEVLL